MRGRKRRIETGQGRGDAVESANRKPDHRVRDMERIQRLRLMDDIFMKVVLDGNLPGVQDIVRVVLGRDDITVVDVKTQDELSNLVGHSVCIDVLARDASGRLFNIEIQRSERGAEEKRARYHLGAVDWHTLPPGADYADLTETWIIFITETDVFKRGLPLYTVNRYIEETGERFHDEGHILYVNGAYQGDDAVGRLMADFRETDPKKMRYRSLGDRAQYYKNTEGGMTSMSSVIKEMMEEVRAEGREEGREEGRILMITALLLGNTEEELLHHARFRGLCITQEEIDAARNREEHEDTASPD